MRPEPDSCAVCSRPLSANSVDGVCPVCFRTQQIAGPPAETLRPAATDRPDARVRASAEPAEELLPPSPPGVALVRRLGTGGMGTVYLGTDAATHRLVAVKLLHAPGDRNAMDRFRVEIRALAELNHSNIVTVFAADLHHYSPFYTMEYVPGGTLARHVGTHGPLAPLAAAALGATLARAAHAAHARGIVHRDIKPGNVLLAGDPADGPGGWVPKLSDFGLAKRIDRDDGLTVDSGALGTPGFMAPEQAAGGAVTARTDVYGLGGTLYHALTGSAPFESDDLRVLLERVRAADPARVRAARADVPAELEAIVHKCLEKDPAARYATAADLAADLDAFAAGAEVRAKALTPARRVLRSVRRNRRSLARSAGAILVLVAAVACGALVSGSAPVPEPPTAHVPAPTSLESLQADLTAGKAVHLLGATGEPRWHTWVRGTSALGPAAGREDACSFQTVGLSMLDLCPDPMTDHYRVRAELCQMEISGREPGGKLPAGGVYQVGLYLGRQTVRGAHGWQMDMGLLISFSEFQGVPHGTGHAQFARATIPRSPTSTPGIGTIDLVAPVAFAQTNKLPGHWRTIEVEVSPTAVQAHWVQPDGRVDPFPALALERLERAYREPTGLDQFAPESGLVNPEWSPRAALGVWSYSSVVAVRNVTLTPLK